MQKALESNRVTLSTARRQLGMAASLLNRGKFKAALQAARPAAQHTMLSAEAVRVMASVLASIEPERYEPALESDILLCFSRPELDHQCLAAIAANQLLHKYQLSNQDMERLDWAELLDAAAKDRLWLTFLSEALNVSLPMESVLAGLRKHLLLNSENKTFEPLTPFLSALAIQCFANQFVFSRSQAEEALIIELEQRLRSTSREEQPYLGLLLALYRPLTGALAIQLRRSTLGAGAWVDHLIRETVERPQQEQELGLRLPSLPSPSAAESLRVSAQYEEYPYPRWKTPPSAKAASLVKVLNGLPGYQPSYIEHQAKLKVLVAGCGTGYEPISLARMDAALDITALDLSRASLAYGALQAQRLGHHHIEFLQGDILHLERMGDRFDFVVSTGVLHHMEDPVRGWEQLCRVTNPGGIMRVSLYSQRARERVVQAHREIAIQGLTSAAGDIRQFRSWLVEQCTDPKLKQLTESTDYYSMSGCRDLLFHEREHRFTLQQVRAMLDHLGLRLIGFDVPSAVARSDFISRFPQPGSWLELEKWDQFEQSYPDTFSCMYQFWLQRPSY